VIVLIIGVCGCGKTTIGKALAKDLGWRFLDADDFHPEANVAKMASGTPLTDDDRWPWFDRVAAEMRRMNAAGKPAVVACSALKQAYRDRLAASGDVRIVYLKGDAATIEARLPAGRGISCRRRCFRASSQRSRSPPTRSWSTSGSRSPRRSRRSRAHCARTHRAW